LEEQVQGKITNESVSEEMLTNKIKELQLLITTKEISLSEIEKKFVIDKFNGRNQNVESWLQDFEKECIRFHINSDEKKIQCLRLFLEGSALDWYGSMKHKLNIENWNQWSKLFLKTYSDRGWSRVRYAYSYKYITGYGSMLEFALKKERLLLECEKTMTETSRISHIVFGLPVNIQDKLDKEEIKTTEDLMNYIQKFDSSVTTLTKNKEAGLSLPRLNYKRSPCYICAKLGKPDRFHLPDICRNKQRFQKNQTSAVNLAECYEDTVNIEFDRSKN
jgi:hypothetical protein